MYIWNEMQINYISQELGATELMFFNVATYPINKDINDGKDPINIGLHLDEVRRNFIYGHQDKRVKQSLKYLKMINEKVDITEGNFHEILLNLVKNGLVYTEDEGIDDDDYYLMSFWINPMVLFSIDELGKGGFPVLKNKQYRIWYDRNNKITKDLRLKQHPEDRELLGLLGI